MTAYYNENDPYAAGWLRATIDAGLVPPGDVDERSVIDVRPNDLAGYTQCHFFAGIGGWGLAMRLAGWPDDRPAWTGSCPCQPFSSAARGRSERFDSKQHLWPIWKELIASGRPPIIFGEQVARATDWHALVGNDLEHLGYAFGSAYLPALGVGQDHIRHRFFFVGHADSDGQSSGALNEEMARVSRDRSLATDMVPTHGLSARVAMLRAFGNAIVPELAAEFIAAASEAIVRHTPQMRESL